MVWAFLRWRRNHGPRWALAVGLLAGWAAITRPADALCYALPIGLAMLWDLRRAAWGDWFRMAGMIVAGADANGENDGFRGTTLAYAVANQRQPQTVALLAEAGASFNDALFFMTAKGFDEKYREQLLAYREKITGEPARNPDQEETLRALQEQVLELTQRLDEAKPSKKPAPKKPAPKP
jgi:hypothetical protein